MFFLLLWGSGGAHSRSRQVVVELGAAYMGTDFNIFNGGKLRLRVPIAKSMCSTRNSVVEDTLRLGSFWN